MAPTLAKANPKPPSSKTVAVDLFDFSSSSPQNNKTENLNFSPKNLPKNLSNSNSLAPGISLLENDNRNFRSENLNGQNFPNLEGFQSPSVKTTNLNYQQTQNGHENVLLNFSPTPAAPHNPSNNFSNFSPRVGGPVVQNFENFISTQNSGVSQFSPTNNDISSLSNQVENIFQNLINCLQKISKQDAGRCNQMVQDMTNR